MNLNFLNFKNEKPAVFFAFFVAVVVILIVAFLLIFYQKPMTKEQEEAWRLGEERKVAQIVSAGNFDKCRDVKYRGADGIDYKIVCQNNVALKKAEETLDINWCQKLDGKLISRDECVRRVIYEMLLKDNNLSVCDKALDQAAKNECVANYWYLKAIHDHDIAVCKNSPAPEFCEEFYWLDKLQKDPHSVSCSNIGLPALKNDCLLFKKALGESDWLKKKDLCENITSSIDLQLICQSQK